MSEPFTAASACRVLVVGAEPEVRERCRRSEPQHAWEFLHVDGVEAAVQVAALAPPAAILYQPSAESSLADAFARLRSCGAPIVCLFGDGVGGTLTRVRSLGGFDQLCRESRLEELGGVLDRAVEFAKLTRENEDLRRRLTQQSAEVALVGRSAAAERLREAVRWVASSAAPVLIQGESGSGKEVVARAVHAASARGAGAFLKVSCAALPPAMLESELFGLEGSAAGRATHAAPGCFVRAREGTVLLDEVSELPLSLQPKLLRALSERLFLPIGGARPEPLEARLLVTTLADLDALVRAGRFRDELRQYLAAVVLQVPPLRERREDLPLLAAQILQDVEGEMPRRLSAGAMERLLDHDWPGNVRELRNVLERAALVSTQGEIRAEQIILDREAGLASSEASARTGDTLYERERAWILQVLRETGGNRSATARRLDVSVRTIRNKLALYRREALERGEALTGELRRVA